MTERELHYLFVADGPSDVALTNHITWLLRRHTASAIVPHWPDLRLVRRPARTLAARVRQAIDLAEPCDMIFVHRDAEKEPRAKRVAEITAACAGLVPPIICVVPVRMLESWLLFIEKEIRHASGNPRGRGTLGLPEIRAIEAIPDPKNLLNEALRTASGLGSHRRQKLPIPAQVKLVAEYNDDFAPLLTLPAFQALDEDIARVVRAHHWA